MPKIKKGDNVVITKGKNRGRTGKVLKVYPKQKRVVVEDANLVKKRMRPEKRGEKGKTVEVPSPLAISNVKLICPSCRKGVRVGYDEKKGEKIRVCKVCGQSF